MDLLLNENFSLQSVIRKLSERYEEGHFYTWAGPTLVAINPLSDVPHLYGIEKIYQIQCEDKKSSSTPHIYRIAQKALQCMSWNERNQAIIVNGDSGAGKTCSARHLLQYLATVESLERKTADTLEDRICWSNPILESFGNAKTIRNANSSRFGKLVQLNYAKGKLATGQIRSYLLEQTRVSSQEKGERNFHIFYQVIAGLSTEEKSRLFLNRQFKVLNLDPTEEDANNFMQTQKAFRELGFNSQDFSKILEILAVLLNLGNVEFLESEDGIWSVNEEQEEWIAVCELAGVEAESLASCLTIRTISAGTLDKRAGVFFRPCESESECVSRRDCLMRLIYSTLFLWLVKQLNRKLSASNVATESFIGILDVYGFESLSVNSLEQLCINYANERLQSFFLQNFLKNQKATLEEEDVRVADIAVLDNSGVIALLDGPVSVFGVLNEECRMKRYPTEEQLVQRVTQAVEPTPVRSSPKRPRRGAANEFRVQHYAGEVTYNAKGMLEKNSDQVPIEMVHLLSNSRTDLIRRLFRKDAEVYGSPTSKTGRKHTVLAKFKSSVDNLLSMLSSCEVHYIRCVKPHEAMEPGPVDPIYLLRKLNECGVTDTVRLASLGLPVRMSFSDFYNRFKCLTCVPPTNAVDHREFSQILIQLLQNSDASIDSSQVQVGKRRIFMSERVCEYLETLRLGIRNKAAKIIWRCWCRYIMRKTTRAALKIQWCWQQYRSRKREAAAIKIQAGYRGYRCRMAYREMIHAVTYLQKTARGWTARRKFQQLKRKIMQDSLLEESMMAESLTAAPPIDEFTDSSGVVSPFGSSGDVSVEEFVTVRKRKRVDEGRKNSNLQSLNLNSSKVDMSLSSPRAVAVVPPFRDSLSLSLQITDESDAPKKVFVRGTDSPKANFEPALTSTFVSFNISNMVDRKEFLKGLHYRRGILSVRRISELNVSFITRKKCLKYAEILPATEMPRGLLDLLD